MSDLDSIDVMDGAGPGPGERGYTMEPPAPASLTVRPPAADQAPDSGSYLTPAEQTFLSRLPAGQPVTPEQVDQLRAIRRRVEGHGGRLPRHKLTVQADLLLLDSVLTNAPQTPREREEEGLALQNELRDIETELTTPSHGHRIAEEQARGAVSSAVAEATRAENERYRRELAAVPVNLQTNRPDPLRQQEVHREHQEALRRIEEARPRIEREILDELLRERTDRGRIRRTLLANRKTEIAGRLRELGAS